MTTNTPTTLELSELEDVEKAITNYNNLITDYQNRIKVMKAKVNELQKYKKENIEAEKKKAEKAEAIKKLLETTKNLMDGLDIELTETETLLEIPPKTK